MSDERISQDEIEKMLNQTGGESPDETPAQGGDGENTGQPDASASQAAKPPAAQQPPASPDDDRELGQDEIEKLLDQSAQPAAARQGPAALDDDTPLGQDDIEKLLGNADPASAAASRPVPRETYTTNPLPGEGRMAQGDVEYLLNRAQEALDSIDSAPDDELAPGVSKFQLQEFGGVSASTEKATLDLVRDVELDLKIELGRTQMYLEDVLKLGKGSVVPLDKLAGDPVDIFVNERLIARGEVLVLNDNFCVRVAELIVGRPAKAP